MKRIAPLFAAGVLASLASSSLGQQAPTATIRINLKEEKAPIPASLYGIFIEDINHGIEGGLHAELIQNRSFEEGVLPPGMKLVSNANGSQRMELAQLPPGVPADRQDLPWPWRDNAGWDPRRELIGWSMQNGPGDAATMKLTGDNPMNAASARSLELTIPAVPTGRVALANSGFWGINAEANTPYQLRFFLRPGSFTGRVTASLESRDGKTLASHAFPAVQPGAAWQELKTTLRPEAADPRARFVLSFQGTGTLQVDYVSLFPPTFKDRPNGLRRDLAQYLADLKPAFVRWPGGCFVQGFSWESAPDFRRTVMPPEERPGMWGYWKYRSTDGFGYHEFLQFCEDVNSEPVYAVFGGMTVHPDNNVPLDQLGPWIQNALDAIEYARGPVTSKWGAARAKLGHPEPFPLKYVEIGNEHLTPLYGEYYKRFRAAIKEKYPDITVIMSMYWSGLNREAIARAGEIDMVDEHAYRDVHWARNNFNYFDRYPRGDWTVFVGEYASQRANGDWAGGLSDSIYLMMTERNGDLVKMACYAPLFRNVNDTTWPVNLIDFDASRSYAHGSYYVQKTFAENRPDVNLATAVDILPKPDPNQPLMAGQIGLGSWNTATEFKELRIYDEQDKLVYSDDFANLANWNTPGHGTWQAREGVLSQSDLRQAPAMLLLKAPELKVGRVTVKARRTSGREGFLLFFNAESRERFLFANYGANGNEFSALQERGAPEGLAFRGGRSTPGAIENDRWYDLALKVGGNAAEMFLDGKSISTASMTTLPAFFATAGYDRRDNAVILKATNYHATPVTAQIHLDASSAVGATGKWITVAGPSPTTDNNFENPTLITAKERPLTNLAPTFSIELPPYSVNLLRIPARP